MASVTHAKVSGAGPAPSPDLVGGDDWDAAHVLDLSTITGTNGGAAAAGGSIAISGGTGDSGNDAGASITVGGGDGAGNAGVVTITGDVHSADETPIVVTAGSDGYGGGFIGRESGNTAQDSTMFGVAGGVGEAGGPASFRAGSGDDGNDPGGEVICYPGDGTGGAGYVRFQTGGQPIDVKAGTADPSAGGGVAANVASLYARDNSGTGELWVKTGTADTAWTKVV